MKHGILGLHHIAIICKDYSVSKNFYIDFLGFSLIKEEFRENRNSWKADLALNENYIIELFSFPNSVERPSYPESLGLRHLAFSSNDIMATKISLENEGIIAEKIRIDESTGKSFFFISDPDGLPIEFYEK